MVGASEKLGSIYAHLTPMNIGLATLSHMVIFKLSATKWWSALARPDVASEVDANRNSWGRGKWQFAVCLSICG